MLLRTPREAVLVYWVVLRVWGTVDPSETTLYNPTKLKETLSQFGRRCLRSACVPGSVQSRGDSQSSPHSDRHRTEALCRQLLETMLQMELPKCRPRWLVNPTTKRCLELDMYNEEHHLAFEYDGAQHDVYTPHYHVNEDHFAYRQLLDRLKTELCREAGVTLIRIPWSEVSFRDTLRTARFLERLLYTHGLPYRPVTEDGPPVQLDAERVRRRSGGSSRTGSARRSP